MKTADSFFALHIEQLYAPFYNIAYEGGTTWYAVQRDDRPLLDTYIVERLRRWFDVPADRWHEVSVAERAAIAMLLYTKRLLFHPDDLLAYGILVSTIEQTSDGVVIGDGDVVHFGHVTKPPEALQPPLPASATCPSTERSVNEAVNFMPLDWLQTGLPSMRAWLLKLKSYWIPAQDTVRALRGDDAA